MADREDTTEIQARVRRFIVEDVLELDDGADLSPDVPLLAGLLDSFGLISLLSFLEETYDITIQHDDVVDENFRSLDDVAALVERKLAQSPRASG